MTEARQLFDAERYYRQDARRGSEMLRRAILRHINPDIKFNRSLPRKPTRRFKSSKRPDPSAQIVERVKNATARYYGIEAHFLTKHIRKRRYAEPRQVAMAIAYMKVMSLPRVAREFDRDHTTVLHACRKVAGNPRFDGDVAAIREALAA